MNENNVSQISETPTGSNPTTGWDAAIAMAGTTQIVTAEVTKVNENKAKGKVYGADVKVAGLQGFLPGSELPRGTKPADVVGKTINVLVLEADPKGGPKGRGRLIVSRKAAEVEEQRSSIASLEAGSIVDGTVVKILDKAGVLVEIDSVGFTGLVPFGELSKRRGAQPSEVASVGDKVQAKVLDVDSDKVKVRLSLKDTVKDRAIEEFFDGIELEQTFENCQVVGVAEYGYFVKLGIKDGLLHQAEIPGKRDEKPTYEKGDLVTVRVIKIDRDKGDIGLTMLDADERARRQEWRERKQQERDGGGRGRGNGGAFGRGGNGGAFGNNRKSRMERFSLPKGLGSGKRTVVKTPPKPRTNRKGEVTFHGHDAFQQLAAHLAPKFEADSAEKEKAELVAKVKELRLPGFGLASTWSLEVLRKKVADANTATDSDTGNNDVEQTA